MKNLKMFAISLVAFAAMTMGVHAASVNVKVCGEEGGYGAISDALRDGLKGKSGCIELEASSDAATLGVGTLNIGDVAGEEPINLEIRLNGNKVTGTAITVNKNSTLTLVGAGELTAASSKELIDVKEGGKLETSGKVILTGVSSKAVIKTAGTVTLGATAEITADTADAVSIVSNTAKVSLNAKVTGADSVVGFDTAYAAKSVSEAVPTVEVLGGDYKATETAFTVDNKMNLTIKNGDVSAPNVVLVNEGVLAVEGGNLTAAMDGGYAVKVASTASDETSVVISGGKLVNTRGVAVSLESLKAHYELGAATYESKDEKTPAIVLVSNLLEEVARQGFITGGDYLYQIAPKGTMKNEKSAILDTFAAMEKVLVKAGLNVTEITKDGKTYRHVEPAKQDQNTGEANTPETQDPNVPSNPPTNDNILVYAGLGLISAATVGFTTRRKENN